MVICDAEQKTEDFRRKFSKYSCSIFALAQQKAFRHIVAARYRSPRFEAAALPGRFLPELGRSLGSGLFSSGV